MTFHRPSLRAAAAAVTLLLLAACVPGGPTEPVPDGAPDGAPGGTAAPASPGDPTTMPPAPAGLERFYSQQPEWTTCEDTFDCAEVEVPLDYSRPEAETIRLSLIRKRGTDPRGTLLVNPGGPGASGVDLVRASVANTFSTELRSGYDVVGFDPRGVSRSAPVTCLTDAERDARRASQPDTSTPEGLEEVRRAAADYAQACESKTGVSLAFVDTVSAARDLDILRAVNGDASLNYLGYSYGTKLGATYASLFPDNVGRMVLDGALDPALSNEEITLGQATAFESEIRAYLADCLSAPGCPFDGDVDDALKQLHRLFADIEENPLTAADGRVVPIGDFVGGFIVPFYEDALWPRLSTALAGALAGDPTEMLALADAGAGREADGSYTGNLNDAFAAINCLDYPMTTDLDEQEADARRLERASPTIGRYLAYGGTQCEPWPFPPTGTPEPVSAPDAAPIVVIGTTGDPATPYAWAEALSEQLESSVLVTYKSHGHTAYGRGGECITNAVDAYLLDGTVPEDGLTC